MKKFVVNTDLIYYASRYKENIAFNKMLGDDLKKANNTRKASKIIMEFEKPTDRLHIYVKPRYLVNDYCEDKDTYYVGIFDTDESVLEGDYSDIEQFCFKKNIIPLFTKKPALGKIIRDILRGYTFRNIFPLNQLEMWDEFYKFNEMVAEKLKTNYSMKDIIWIQDHNCFLLPELIDNQNIVISFNLPFTSLAVGIPYYKRIMKNLVRSKAISFFDSCGKLTFNEFAAPFTIETGRSPITTIHSFGTDVDLLDEIVSSEEFKSCDLFNDVDNLLVLPYNSTNHLLSIEAYLSKYKTPISVLLLNLGDTDLEAQVEVQRLVAYLTSTYRVNITTFLPRDNIELFKIISNSKIGFVKSLKGYFFYFNRQFIGDLVCDYQEMADKIASLIENSDKTISKGIETGKAKRYLTTPSCIRERMLSFALPQSMIDFEQSETINLSQSIVMNNTHEEKEDDYPTRLMDIKDINESMHDETSSNNTSILNKSRIIQVTSVDTKNNDMGLKPMESLLQAVQNSNKTVLLLDYDGTLTPIVSNTDDATPSDRLLSILSTLNKKKNVEVFIVSGRSQKDMDKFIPKEIDVFAEHGTFRRNKGEWNQLSDILNIELPYKIAKFYTDRTPNSTLEKKSNGFVFHYRNCDFDIGEKQARSLYEQLKRIDSSSAKCGKKIIEFRSGGKHEILKYIRGDLIIAAGDDVTDEDMFALRDVVSIKVGKEKSKAQFYVEDVDEMICFLDLISKSV